MWPIDKQIKTNKKPAKMLIWRKSFSQAIFFNSSYTYLLSVPKFKCIICVAFKDF